MRLLAAVLLLAGASGRSVWPKPLHQADTGAVHVIDPAGLRFSCNASSPILLDAFKRYSGIITAHAGASFHATDTAAISTCAVYVGSTDDELTLETDASYSLTVSGSGIQISAETVYGAVYGLETLSQLVDRGAFINGTQISDRPRYQFRASMIDTSRHYYPLEVILQHLDAMSYNKMNVLHWHIVDSISFPFQSTTFPEMSTQGAYSPDHVYTHDDVSTVIAYAKNRGIRVIPEFDTPGHVQQGYAALDPPILTQCYDPKTGKPIEGDGATGPLDVTLPATYTFLAKLYSEVAKLFPDKFVHVGGDEVPSACWASNPHIQQYMKAHNLRCAVPALGFTQRAARLPTWRRFTSSGCWICSRRKAARTLCGRRFSTMAPRSSPTL